MEVSEKLQIYQERGILKDSNMEGKIPASQKEAATVPRCLGGISQRSHGNDIKVSSFILATSTITWEVFLDDELNKLYLSFCF